MYKHVILCYMLLYDIIYYRIYDKYFLNHKFSKLSYNTTDNVRYYVGLYNNHNMGDRVYPYISYIIQITSYIIWITMGDRVRYVRTYICIYIYIACVYI